MNFRLESCQVRWNSWQSQRNANQMPSKYSVNARQRWKILSSSLEILMQSGTNSKKLDECFKPSSGRGIQMNIMSFVMFFWSWSETCQLPEKELEAMNGWVVSDIKRMCVRRSLFDVLDMELLSITVNQSDDNGAKITIKLMITTKP